MSAASSRLHVVLVPGFGGFDALGQLEYYAGVTPLFRSWAGGRHAVLHYFDNLPTAGVVTRAARLRSYLARRVARGEIQAVDTVALVGHSTGGLDVRRLLLDLEARGADPIPVDGPYGAALTVSPAELLGLVRRVVFLSVPQWGTNIADWVRAHRIEREAAVAELRASVLAANVSPVDDLETWVAGRAARLAGAELLLAVQDALAELHAGPRADPTAVAAAQEAAAELSLWLRYVATDFAAIDDLTAEPRASSMSPAHVDAAGRESERMLWASHQIQTRSYATLGARPFAFADGAEVPPWRLLEPSTYPDATPKTDTAMKTDLVYRACYRACAGGPFRLPDRTAPASAKTLGGETRVVQTWDNDGIVNTASMLWPNGAETVLVPGDHGDIIGHYRLRPAVQPSRRKHHTYDLLHSASDFGDGAFEAVWKDVFEFCASAT